MVVSAAGKKNITLYFNNVSLLKSNWTIKGLNLIVDQSDLFDSLLFVQGKGEQKARKYVHIYQSRFGHLHVRDAYKVNILKCSLEDKSINYNMMEFYKSNVTIIDSLFDFLTFPDGTVLLSAESSQIRIKDVTIRYSITYQSIINVENDSQLELENVLFTKNMFYYHVKFSAFYSLTAHSSAVVK